MMWLPTKNCAVVPEMARFLGPLAVAWLPGRHFP